MSFQALAWALKQSTGSVGAKAVLVALASYSGEHGECFPSLRRLGGDLEQSQDTIRRRLRDLERLGLVVRKPRFGAKGTQTSNGYVLLCDDDARAFAARETWQVPWDSKGELDIPAKKQPEPSDVGDLWDAFKDRWAWSLSDRPEAARRAFRLLATDERDLAIRFAPSYAAHCSAISRKQCHASTWLREKGWQPFVEAEARSPHKPSEHVWIEGGSPEAAAWDRHVRAVEGKRGLFMAHLKRPDGTAGRGCYKPSKWPPRRASDSGPADPEPGAQDLLSKPSG
jgi:hypothetical protein